MVLTLPPAAYTVTMLVASNVFMGQEVRMNYVYAGACLLGAVYFIFRA